MSRTLPIAWIASVLLLAHATGAAAAQRFEFTNGDRVVWLGDTFLEREGDYGQIETRLTAALAPRRVTFRNLAWAADTPTGRARASFDWNKPEAEWLKRVGGQIALVKPTVAILSYGMTAALEQLEIPPADRSRHLDKFGRDLDALVETLRRSSEGPVRVIVLGVALATPPGDPSQHASLLTAARAVDAALRAFATRAQAHWVDLDDLESRARGGRRGSLTDNGVALGEDAYSIAAELIVERLGLTAPPRTEEATALLRSAILKKNELFFHRWRPANWTYLFGFRKHEQGQNSVEIPRFDPLIAQWDERIGQLSDLRRQDSAVKVEVKRQLAPAAAAAPTPPRPRPRQPVPSFTVADGFEATLWAENPRLHKPIQMNWDALGRLWVASSEIYPQIQPGQPATDTVVVLEDTDGDGRADRSTTFAEGLLIPTGVLPDNRGGCYVAASSRLLHFADTDGDGRADRRSIVLSSFGTEDTHHNLHTLRWGYDGHIYLNQSIYTHSHIETPYGVRRLNSAGIWRFNPDTWQLDVFTKGGCNPWGHHWDQYGNSFFTDGAGFKGVYHAMEGATYFTYSDMRREAESISPGNYPKFCSLEIVHSPAFPTDWQGQVITCDFRAQRIVRFALTDSGSSFQTREMPDLLRSTNVTFRPIDLRFGPDGALYIADWSNPIIQHGEVDFRDPRRDKEHGRIWRVTGRGHNAPARPADLTRLTLADWLDRTLSNNGWEQEQARVLLRQSDPDRVLNALRRWLPRQQDPRARLEALWLHEAFDRPDAALLAELAAASDPRLRTAAARQLAR